MGDQSSGSCFLAMGLLIPSEFLMMLGGCFFIERIEKIKHRITIVSAVIHGIGRLSDSF